MNTGNTKFAKLIAVYFKKGGPGPRWSPTGYATGHMVTLCVRISRSENIFYPFQVVRLKVSQIKMRSTPKKSKVFGSSYSYLKRVKKYNASTLTYNYTSTRI